MADLRVDVCRGSHWVFQDAVEDCHQPVQGERLGPQQLIVWLEKGKGYQPTEHPLINSLSKPCLSVSSLTCESCQSCAAGKGRRAFSHMQPLHREVSSGWKVNMCEVLHIKHGMGIS